MGIKYVRILENLMSVLSRLAESLQGGAASLHHTAVANTIKLMAEQHHRLL